MVGPQPTDESETPRPLVADLVAPLLGEHTREALRRILGLTDEELDAAERSGALR